MIHKNTLKDLKSHSKEIISSHDMEQLLKKGKFEIVSNFNDIHVLNNLP